MELSWSSELELESGEFGVGSWSWSSELELECGGLGVRVRSQCLEFVTAEFAAVFACLEPHFPAEKILRFMDRLLCQGYY